MGTDEPYAFAGDGEGPAREVVVAPYRFFYRVDKKTVWIVAVWHGAQISRSPEDSA